MKAILCDVPGCGKVVEGGPHNDYSENNGVEWSIAIGLNGDVDRCEECSRKLFAKITRLAWDDLKKKRKPKAKPDLKVAE